MNNNLVIAESSLKNNERISKFWNYKYDDNHDKKVLLKNRLGITLLVIAITKTKDTLR